MILSDKVYLPDQMADYSACTQHFVPTLSARISLLIPFVTPWVRKTGLSCRSPTRPQEPRVHYRSSQKSMDKSVLSGSRRQYYMNTFYRISKYLKSTPGKGMLFEPHSHLDVERYTDSYWAGPLDDRRFTSGYCTFVGGN